MTFCAVPACIVPTVTTAGCADLPCGLQWFEVHDQRALPGHLLSHAAYRRVPAPRNINEKLIRDHQRTWRARRGSYWKRRP